ncbi:MauE/DoxX family redox-associated membrane protein [Planctomycetota bacterium]
MRRVRNLRGLVPRQVLSRFLHWPLSLLFLYSGSVKIFRLRQFSQSVGDFGIVLDWLVKPVALIVCFVELGIAYVLWQQRSWAMLATATLLVGFLGVLSYGMAIGLDIECGCFGSGYKLKLKQQLGVDLGLLLWCVCTHWILNNEKETIDE